MGTFLVLLSEPERNREAAPLFAAALAFARTVPGQSPSGVLEADGLRAASFPRRNGSGAPIVTDPATGSWLAVAGTWFHGDGYASGQEARILQEFLRSGIRALADKLQGFFALVVADARQKTVHVVTDIVGSCHCFLRAVDGGLAISNSSLLLASLGGSQLDPLACQEFIATGVIYEDRSLFREVRKLAPACIYTFSRGTLQSSRPYWRISNLAPESLDVQRASRALWAALADSARLVENAFARPVCDLTGGYDSRALVAAFHAARVPISTAVTGPPQSRDVLISKGLAEMARLPHVHLQKQPAMTLDRLRDALPLTDGEYDLVEYSRIQETHQTLAEQFDISINGSFGELARGYWWELLFPHTGHCRPLPARKVAARRYAAGAFDSGLFHVERRVDLVSHLTGVVERTLQGLAGRPNTFQMDQVYLGMRMQRWQGRIASSTNRIWPCLSPFMFRSVLEVALAAQARARRHSLLVRRMLAEFSPAWANFPRENGCPCLPFAWNNFYRFAPLLGYYGGKAWTRTARLAGLRGTATDSKDADSPRMRLWSQDAVRALLDPRSLHLSVLLDPAALDNFLRRSQNPAFAFGAQWNRLLTVECAVSALHEAGKRTARCV
jgi:asparagine synthase (glutamine-hydrolysing)